jgi:hypothetical protein
LLLALSVVGILFAIFFLLNAILGKGGDLPTAPSLAICIGSLFESAFAWTIAKSSNALQCVLRKWKVLTMKKNLQAQYFGKII